MFDCCPFMNVRQRQFERAKILMINNLRVTLPRHFDLIQKPSNRKFCSSLFPKLDGKFARLFCTTARTKVLKYLILFHRSSPGPVQTPGYVPFVWSRVGTGPERQKLRYTSNSIQLNKATREIGWRRHFLLCIFCAAVLQIFQYSRLSAWL